MTSVSMRELLRQLTVIAFAMVTVVCAGIAGAGRTLAVGPVEVVAAISAPQPSQQQWRVGEEPADVDCDAVEAERDDDDRDDDDFGDEDNRSHALADLAIMVRGAGAPRCPGRALRSEPQTDTSRFACGIGLPRGPPV